MSHDDDTDNLLAGVDLHAWRVPPAPDAQRSSILLRALSPAAAPRRPRLAWMVGALVLVNAAVAAIIVIIISRPVERVVTVAPAGGGSAVDAAKVQDLLRRLQREQQILEGKVAEVAELRTVIAELSAKAQQCEDERRQKTLQKQPDRTRPRSDPPGRVDVTPDDIGCDEVSCVLDNYTGSCCLKYRKVRPGEVMPSSSTTTNALPESLDRHAISAGVAAIKTSIVLCGEQTGATGKVVINVRVNPAGRVVAVSLRNSPDPQLGSCVLDAMKRATFEPTQQGGSFSYPFVF